MMIRKTHDIKRKKVNTDRYEEHKRYVLVAVTTYWFLFIPIYSSEKIIN